MSVRTKQLKLRRLRLLTWVARALSKGIEYFSWLHWTRKKFKILQHFQVRTDKGKVLSIKNCVLVCNGERSTQQSLMALLHKLVLAYVSFSDGLLKLGNIGWHKWMAQLGACVKTLSVTRECKRQRNGFAIIEVPMTKFEDKRRNTPRDLSGMLLRASG